MFSPYFIVIFLLVGLFLLALICLFFVSRKTQKVMQDVLNIMLNPEQIRIKNATNVLNSILQDEISKIEQNFNVLYNNLNTQIDKTNQIKNTLDEQNTKLVSLADEAIQKNTDIHQKLTDTVKDLDNIVKSDSWTGIHNVLSEFYSSLDNLLGKLENISNSVNDKTLNINEQIKICGDTEQQLAQQLQNSFDTNATNMNSMTTNIEELTQKINTLDDKLQTDFNNIKTVSAEYTEVMRSNDKLLNEYFVKLSEFSKRSEKELIKQKNLLSDTSNVSEANIRLVESSLDKQIKKIEETIDSLRTLSDTNEKNVKNINTSMTEVMNNMTKSFAKEIQDFSAGVTNELSNVSGVANTTLENTKTATDSFSTTITDLATGVRKTLIDMNESHRKLVVQSSELIKLSKSTAEQLEPLSELIEKYYKALPDLSQGSKDVSMTLNMTIENMVEKINIMKTTIGDSLQDMKTSSEYLTNLADKSKEQMQGLMTEYQDAVTAMKDINEKMAIARATTPMNAINTNPTVAQTNLNNKDTKEISKRIINALFEQSIDLSKSLGTIPDAVITRYENGETGVYSKWLLKVLESTDKKQLRSLLKKDTILQSQATQYIHEFEKLLSMSLSDKNKENINKSELGRIYSILRTNI